MSGYIPTDKDIATMVSDLKKKDPVNANAEYVQQMLVKMKLMYRDLGRIDEELLHKEMEEFKQDSTKD